MSQSLSGVFVHLIFSTKDRYPFLSPRPKADEMHAYLAGICLKLGCPPVLINGVADHVHILAQLGRTVAQSDWVRELKRASTIWMRNRNPEAGAFSWQNGYGIFSVSVSNIDAVKGYIAAQEVHHAHLSFQDELRAFLRKHGIGWDECYLWE